MENNLSALPEAPWTFPRVWGAGLLALVAATWSLWFPGFTPDMPLVPLLPILASESGLNTWIAHLASALLVISLPPVIFFPARCRWCWWCIACSLLISFAVDQHRLQPWAYQSSIYAMVFASMDRMTASRWLIPLAASVYVYSAAGKFDYQFAHTVGQDFLDAAMAPLGGIPGSPGEAVRARIALLFPTYELIAGLCVVIPKTRRAAAVALIAMHCGLILILGPWNRDHSNGVLLWNLLLICQAFLLMWQTPRPPTAKPETAARAQPGAQTRRIPDILVRSIILVALAAPLLERRGYWDHWTSWSLYSPHTSYVDVEIHRSAIERLPRSLHSHLSEDADGDGWRLLNFGSWSLAVRSVPVYPQARYQLALAESIAQEYGLTEEIRAKLFSASDRRSGTRTQKLMRDRSEIESALRRFWLRPRMAD